MMTASDSLRVIQTEAAAIIAPKLIMAQNAAAALSQTTAYEADFRTMLLTQIKLAGGNDLATNDKNALRTIGDQCPDTNGEIVRYAPLLLPVDETRKYFDETYFAHCLNNAANLRNGNAPKLTEREIEIWAAYPNPTFETVTVEFAQKTTGHWTVLDLAGRPLLTGTLDEPQKAFVVRGLDKFGDGVYALTFLNSEGKLLSRFITVLH